MRPLATRRAFLGEVGRGMVLAAVGSHLAMDLGLAPAAMADDAPDRLTFGELEPLVCVMQETPVAKLMPMLIERIKAGMDLKTLVAAGALANARTFGGEDYVGFHTLMAMSPAYRMALELPPEHAPLPILKVLYRNTNRLNEVGAPKRETLRPVPADSAAAGTQPREAVRDAVRRQDMAGAERAFASFGGSPEDLFNAVLVAVEDTTEVHRVVLPYRAFDLLDIVGRAHAHTMLRQSVHYCVNAERWATQGHWREPRTLLPKVLDEHKLMGKTPGTRQADDAWVEEMSLTIFNSPAAQAAHAVGAALAEGFAPDAIGEAISLAANQLVLRDAGRALRDESPGKPIGSVHGDSIGVHACDSANAWRNMARIGDARHQIACAILGAYQVALDRDARGGDFKNWTPAPLPLHRAAVKETSADALLTEADSAIRQNLQGRVTAVVHRYGELDLPMRPMFDVMLKYATSEDGALHAEKYYRTVCEEFAATRPAFRWRQLVALARVTASEYGRPAPGVNAAKEMLKA